MLHADASGLQPSLTAVLHDLVTSAAAMCDARYGAIGVLDGSGQRHLHFVTVRVDSGEADAPPADDVRVRSVAVRRAGALRSACWGDCSGGYPRRLAM